MDVGRNRKRIQEDIPKRLSNLSVGIQEDIKYKTEDDHDDGGTVAASGGCGKHKSQIAEKKHREKQLKGHFKDVNRV